MATKGKKGKTAPKHHGRMKKEKAMKKKSEPTAFERMESEEKAKGGKNRGNGTLRIPTGIGGFDDLIEGGLPKGGIYLLSGKCGTGKTIFGLQFLNYGANNGEPGVYIALEKEPEDIMASTRKFGWDFEGLSKKDSIAIMKPDMHRFDTFKKNLEDQIYRMGAKRLVIDPFSLISAYFHNDVFEVRRSIVELATMLKRMECTAIIISDIPEGSPYLSYTGYMEFVVSGVILLDMVKKEANTFARSVLVRKMQDTNHSLKLVPIEISKEGLVAYPDAEVF